jgi:hypothetical protein
MFVIFRNNLNGFWDFLTMVPISWVLVHPKAMRRCEELFVWHDPPPETKNFHQSGPF